MHKEYYLNEKTKPYSQGTWYELAEQNVKKMLPNKNTSQGQVNGLGFVGRGEGVMAEAVCLIEKKK